MAKNKIEIDVKVDDKGTTKKVALGAKQAADGLDKTGKSARTADRNLKGTAQASANSTKNFSKMSQGMGGLVAVYASFAAQVFALSAAFQFLKSAFETSQLIAGQEALGAATGVAYKTITQSLIEATGGQIAYAEAAKAAAIGTAAGLSPTQLEKLGKAAKNTSQALGRDLTDSFRRLISGVTKAEPELLDELGIILRLETAKKNYADQVGKTAQSLNLFEQSQAIINEVLTQAETKFGAIEKIMDPAGTSLNKFLVSFDNVINSIKRFTTSALAPVFEFLSNNTTALLGVLISFSALFLRAVLPDFKKMAEGAKDSLKAQEKYLDNLSKKLKSAELDVKNLTKSEADMRKEAVKSAKSTLKAGGMDLTPSKSGQTGADFLLGKSDSAGAARQADRILKAAEKQIAQSGEVITGKLKGFNKRQVEDLRASYAQRSALLSQYGIKEDAMLQKAALNWKVYVVKAKIALSTLKTFAISTTKVMAIGMNKVMIAAGWIGAIFLVIDLLKMAKDFVFPLSEEMKAANEATDSYVSTLEGLNKELSKMEKIRFNKDVSFGLQELAVQGAQAAISADLYNKTIAFNALNESSKGYKKAEKELVNLFTTVSSINPEYKEFLNQLQNSGKVDTKALFIVQENMAAFLHATTQLPEALKAVSAEIDKIAGTAKIDPLAPLISSLETAREHSDTTVEGLKAQLENTIPATITDLENQMKGLETKNKMWHGGNRVGGKDGPETIILPKNQEEFNRLAEAVAAAKSSLEKLPAELEKATEQQNYLNILAEKFVGIQEQTTSQALRAQHLREEAALGQTLGITAAQKIANINLKENERTARTLEMSNKILAAEALLAAANESKTIDNKDQVEAAKAALDAANSESTILEHNNSLEREKDSIAEQQILNQLEILNLKRQEAIVEQSLNNLKEEGKRISSGAFSFGFEQARQVAENTLQSLREAQTLASRQVTTATTAQNQVLKPGSTFTQAEKDAAQSALTSAQQRKRAADLDIELFTKRGEVFVNAISKEKELTQARLQGLSLNPIEQAYQNSLIQAKTQGIFLTEEQKMRLYEEVEAQYALNEAYEMKSNLFNSLSSNITSAFSSIVDGTKSAKQAFADMALAILKDISQMIIRMLVMRAIMSLPGFGVTQVQATNMQNFGVTQVQADLTSKIPIGPPKFRYGGITKMPGYAVGGIARGPNAGYPAMLHGTEAVVPLPNGKSIPVDMKGAGQNNNVVVNVSVDNQGNAQTSTQSQSGAEAGQLGSAIARAVQQELQNQKRSGGILNPYGVA
jgi:hypothetical protein